MVTRKNSLPYPQSPTSSSTQQASLAPAAGQVFAATSPGSQMAGQFSEQSQSQSFMDSDNPWQDHRASARPSQTQQPSEPNGSRHQREHSLTNIPQALRPGGSGQDTPRSSIDSGESRDWWDEEDAPAGQKSPTRSPARSPVREIPDSLRPRGPSPSGLTQPPSPNTVKRKPLPSSAAPPEDAPTSPNEFASNNPFRRASDAAPPSRLPPAPPTAAPPSVPSVTAWAPNNEEPEGKGKTPLREPNFSASITDFSRMTINDGHRPDPSAYNQAQTPQQEVDDPWKQFDSPPAPIQQQHSGFAQTHMPSSPLHAPPPIPSQQKEDEQPHRTPSPAYQAPHEPAQEQWQATQNPWASQQANTQQPPSAPPPPQSLRPGFRSQGQEMGVIGVEPQRPTTAHSVQPRISDQRQEVSLLDDEDFGPASPAQRPKIPESQPSQTYSPPPGGPPGRAPLGEETPPPKPPRPTVRTTPLSEAEQAKNAEYRNETYQIKHFNWFDHGSGRLRRSSMLTQNKNGPCPLLALVNALILGARDESQAALDDALRSREQVSLGLIIETLMYELVDRSAAGGAQLPDVDELNAFLLRLRTGMNANPRFAPQSGPPPNLMDARNSILHMPQERRAQLKAGTFEATGDIKLYGAFSIPLVHGWIPEVGSDAAQAFARSAQTYEDAQAIQFGEEELEYKLTRGGLSPDEQRVWEDIMSIKNFFQMHPTQLTSTGLENIQQSLSSGSFAIMFRNDHFSTIYKHPQSGQLYTLITDAGYADRDEIIWESLVDITGSTNEFYSGDFMPVSHHQGASNSSSAQHLNVPDSDNAPLSPQQQQEQHDADFAMALQMQEEEEQRQRAEQARRRRTSGQQPAAPNQQQPQNPGGSNGNIPITLTRSRQSATSASDALENRPTVPPRRQQGPPAVNRPTDATDEDAPPAYEEAAKGRPYIPPVGSPLHPASGPAGNNDTISPMSSSAQLTGTVNNAHPPGPNAPFYGGNNNGGPGSGSTQRPGHGRIPSNVSTGRLSAYQESTPTQMQMPGGWSGRQASYGQGQPGQGQGMPMPVESTGRRKRSDCVVM